MLFCLTGSVIMAMALGSLPGLHAVWWIAGALVGALAAYVGLLVRMREQAAKRVTQTSGGDAAPWVSNHLLDRWAVTRFLWAGVAGWLLITVVALTERLTGDDTSPGAVRRALLARSNLLQGYLRRQSFRALAASAAATAGATAIGSLASAAGASPAAATSSPTAGTWQAIRMCESGGNYGANTGNGYYGAYQFSLATWSGLGYAGLPSGAAPATQDQAAQKLAAEAGLSGSWPVCSQQTGAVSATVAVTPMVSVESSQASAKAAAAQASAKAAAAQASAKAAAAQASAKAAAAQASAKAAAAQTAAKVVPKTVVTTVAPKAAAKTVVTTVAPKAAAKTVVTTVAPKAAAKTVVTTVAAKTVVTTVAAKTVVTTVAPKAAAKTVVSQPVAAKTVVTPAVAAKTVVTPAVAAKTVVTPAVAAKTVVTPAVAAAKPMVVEVSTPVQAAPISSGSSYTIKAGDTLAGIAQRAGTTVAALAAANHISDPNVILVGQVLALKGPASSSAAPVQAAPISSGSSYTIKAGDTLAAIAQRSGTTVAALAAANHISDPNVIFVGQVLNTGGATSSAVPVSSSTSAPRPAVSSSKGTTAVGTALAQVGVPYLYGGASPGGFDCSGLIMYAWAAAGVSLPHNSVAQYQATTRVSASELQPGDIVFYDNSGGPQPGHNAMYIGNGQVVAANHSGTLIQTQSITYDGTPMGYGRVR